MAPIIKTASNTVQVSFNGHWTNGRAVSAVMHWRYDATPPDDEVWEDFEDTHLTAFQTEFVPQYANNYTFDGISFLDITEPTGGRSNVRPPNGALPTTGAQSGLYAGPSQCCLVTKVAGLGGRGTRSGRIYLPWVASTEYSENGVLDATRKANIQGHLDTWYDDMKSFNVPPTAFVFVVPHWLAGNRPPVGTGGEWPSTGASIVTGLVCQDLIATQRRRLR